MKSIIIGSNVHVFQYMRGYRFVIGYLCGRVKSQNENNEILVFILLFERVCCVKQRPNRRGKFVKVENILLSESDYEVIN